MLIAKKEFRAFSDAFQMPLDRKNTGSIIYHIRETSVALWVAFALMWPTYALSSEQFIEECITIDNGSIVISAVDQGSVTITGGRITASAGESIRLLPGTHIRGDEQVTVSVVSREYQEALAEEAAVEEKKQAVESILKRRDHNTLPLETASMIRGYRGTGSRTHLREQQYVCAILPVRTQTSVVKTEIFIGQSYPFRDQENNRLICHIARLHQPILTWGKRCETIAVMRT